MFAEVFSYDRELYDNGVSDGIDIGIKQEKIQTAKNFLNMGLSIAQVMEGTGLSKQEIEQLA